MSEVIKILSADAYTSKKKNKVVASTTSEPYILRYTFTREDNPRIPAGKRYTLFTCSAENYALVRPQLATVFNQFIVVINSCQDKLKNKELELNADNPRFCTILDTAFYDNQLFIIPTMNCKFRNKVHVPYKGIRIVTQNFTELRGKNKDGELLIVSGDHRYKLYSRVLDQYSSFLMEGNRYTNDGVSSEEVDAIAFTMLQW